MAPSLLGAALEREDRQVLDGDSGLRPRILGDRRLLLRPDGGLGLSAGRGGDAAHRASSAPKQA